jgi:integrase/recombinase XerD
MEHLTRNELKELLTVAKAKSERDWLILLIGFSHALRVSEIIGLDVNDVKDGYMTVQRLKGSMKTTQALVASSDPLFDEKTALAKWALKVSAGKLFNISRKRVWQLMKEYGTAAHIPAHKCHPHVLKHTTAKLALNNGMKLDALKKYMGHESLSSTGAYLQCDDDEASKAFADAMVISI